MIVMDTTEISLVITALIIAVVIAFLAGKYMDVRWRAKAMRFITRKEHYVVNLLSADGKRYKPFVVAIPNGIIVRNGKRWVIPDNRIYREGETAQMTKGPSVLLQREGKTEEGIDLKGEDTRQKMEFDEVGLPTVFISEKDFKAYGLEHSEDLRPDEIDAIQNADLQTELARKMAGKTGMDILPIVTVIAVLAVLGLCWFMFSDMGVIKNLVQSMAPIIPPVVV